VLADDWYESRQTLPGYFNVGRPPASMVSPTDEVIARFLQLHNRSYGLAVSDGIADAGSVNRREGPGLATLVCLRSYSAWVDVRVVASLRYSTKQAQQPVVAPAKKPWARVRLWVEPQGVPGWQEVRAVLGADQGDVM